MLACSSSFLLGYGIIFRTWQGRGIFVTAPQTRGPGTQAFHSVRNMQNRRTASSASRNVGCLSCVFPLGDDGFERKIVDLLLSQLTWDCWYAWPGSAPHQHENESTHTAVHVRYARLCPGKPARATHGKPARVTSCASLARKLGDIAGTTSLHKTEKASSVDDKGTYRPALLFPHTSNLSIDYFQAHRLACITDTHKPRIIAVPADLSPAERTGCTSETGPTGTPEEG